MRRYLLPLGVALLVSTLGISPAVAFMMTQKCVVANQLCFIMRIGVGDLTAEQRLDRVNERLAYVLGYENPHKVRMVTTAGGEQTIWVGRSLLVTVTHADARANGTHAPRTVGRIWLANLRRALPEAVVR